jgi:hypothetical protein
LPRQSSAPARTLDLPEVKIIISSEHSQHEVEKTIGGFKVSGFIQKPYAVGPFLELIKKVIQEEPVKVVK